MAVCARAPLEAKAKTQDKIVRKEVACTVGDMDGTVPNFNSQSSAYVCCALLVTVVVGRIGEPSKKRRCGKQSEVTAIAEGDAVQGCAVLGAPFLPRPLRQKWGHDRGTSKGAHPARFPGFS